MKRTSFEVSHSCASEHSFNCSKEQTGHKSFGGKRPWRIKLSSRSHITTRPEVLCPSSVLLTEKTVEWKPEELWDPIAGLPLRNSGSPGLTKALDSGRCIAVTSRHRTVGWWGVATRPTTAQTGTRGTKKHLYCQQWQLKTSFSLNCGYVCNECGCVH